MRRRKSADVRPPGAIPLISARIPQEAIDALEAIAARDGETRSKLVRRAILEWLESQRR